MTDIDWWPVARLDELQAFIAANWKRGHILGRDAELLRWQHGLPGDTERVSVLVAERPDAGIVGILGVIYNRATVLGREASAAWLTTWLVLEEERRHQTATKLLLEVLRGHDGFVGTLGGNEITLAVLGRLRFETVPALPRWVRPLDADACASLLTAAGAAAPRTVPSLDPPAPDRGLEVRAYDPEQAPAWDRAWTERFAPRLIGTARDAAHLRWRYLEHPRFDYVISATWAGETPTGLLVYRVQRVRDRPESVVRIVELLGDDDARGALLADMVAQPAVRSAAFADYYGASEAQRPPDASGFAAEDPSAPPPALFAPLDARRAGLTAAVRLFGPSAAPGSQVLSGASAYITRSDCDQDRPN
ncbi:MAG: hypothetical protein WKF94_02890 [Solirubrobacteraceae bacterium]